MKTPFHPPNDHVNAEIVSPGRDRSPASPWLSVVVNGIWAIAGAASVVGFMAVRSSPITTPMMNRPVAQNAVAATILPPSSTPALAAVPSSSGNQNFITDVVNQVGPAVVRIDASRTVKASVPEAFQDPFFRQFFGSDLPIQPNQRVERGLGSGFLINANGRIITNAHVVDGADRVKVTLKDGRSFEGKVLGADPVTDVAVVEIQASNLPSVKLANSDRLQPGEWTIAIGNPLGLDSTVTVGILSATGRSSSQVGVPDKRVSFLQTDAAINPGNSGGPLLNQQGEVIGVNTAIIGNAQGLGFAIPINTVTRIADQLTRDGKVAHPFLGIQMVTLSPEMRDNINQSESLPQPLRQDKGVLIAKVLPNSPAARAGLKEGDVIQKVAGQPVSQAEAVQRSVEAAAIGESLALEVDRNDRTLTIQVKPGELPTSR